MHYRNMATSARLRPVALVLLSIGGLLLFHAPVEAQEQTVLIVLNNGKVPDAPVQVSVILNAGKQPVAETGADGRAAIDPSILNLGKGTRVTVYVSRCVDGEVEVILVPEGEDDPCVGEDTEAGDRCECERIGAFLWGDENVVIDIDTGTVTTGGGPAGPGVPTVTLGFKADAAFWTELEDLVCGQPSLLDCRADDTSLLLHPFLEVRLGALPISLGVAGSYSRLDFEQRFDRSSDPLLPISVDGEQDVWSLEGYGRLDWSVNGWLSPYVLAGVAWVWNSAEFESAFPAENLIEERNENGARFRAGAGFDALLTDSFGLRFNGDYVSGGSGDADTHFRLGGGVIVLVY